MEGERRKATTAFKSNRRWRLRRCARKGRSRRSLHAGVHLNQVSIWKRKATDGMRETFSTVRVLGALVLLPCVGAHAVQPPVSGCEGWNTEEFFTNASVELVASCLNGGAGVQATTEDGFTPLHFAAQLNEDSAVVGALLAAGAEIEARDDRGFTPLHRAASVNESLEVIEALISGGAKVNAQHDDGIAPIQNAVFANANPAVIEALIAAGADPSVRTEDGRTLLHVASYNENPAVVEQFIVAGADPNVRAEDGRTPLHVASRYNENPAVVEQFIVAGADPNVRAEDGRTPLHAASRYNENPAVLKALLDAGADIRLRDSDGETPLHYAARGSNPAAVEALLAAGADPAARSDYGTPLLWAIPAGFEDGEGRARPQAVVKALLAAGADPNEADTLTRAAVLSGENDTWANVVGDLLEAGADPNRDESGSVYPPLYMAVRYGGSADAIKALLEAGADPNYDDGRIVAEAASHGDAAIFDLLWAVGADPMTPRVLEEAARNRDPAVLERLLEAGADPNSVFYGYGLLHVAAAANSATVKILLEAGANPLIVDDDGNTPLHAASMYAFNLIDGVNAVDVLLAAGVNPNARNEDGETAWDLVQEVLETGGRYTRAEELDGEELAARQKELKQSAAYWRLNDARFKVPAAPSTGVRSTRPNTAAREPSPPVPASRPASAPDAQCLIPGFPSPADPENLGFPWCPASVGFQVRAFAISAAGAQCAIATETSSTPEQIAARRKETADLCSRLETVAERLGAGGGPDCRCPADWR